MHRQKTCLTSVIYVVVTASCGQDRKYLVNAVSLHSKLPSKALGGIRLGAVLGQLALIVVTHSRLSANTQTKKRQLQNIKKSSEGASEEGKGQEKSNTAGNTASGWWC